MKVTGERRRGGLARTMTRRAAYGAARRLCDRGSRTALHGASSLH